MGPPPLSKRTSEHALFAEPGPGGAAERDMGGSRARPPLRVCPPGARPARRQRRSSARHQLVPLHTGPAQLAPILRKQTLGHDTVQARYATLALTSFRVAALAIRRPGLSTT